MDPLTAIDGWPGTVAAAAVVGEAGVVATRGPVDAAFELASVTKPLVAFAALVAVEEGTIDLDDPAGPPGATVRHLLAHASGLPFEPGGPIGPPGRRRTYSNVGFDVLGAHLAEQAAIEIADYVAAAVFEPLRMTSTALAGSPASGATSTVADLARFANELLAPALIAAATLAEATTPAFPGLAGVVPGIGRFDPCDWGLGFELKGAKVPHWTPPRAAPGTFGHFGASGTFLWVDPVARLALVCLTDRPFGPWALEVWPPLGQSVLDRYQ